MDFSDDDDMTGRAVVKMPALNGSENRPKLHPLNSVEKYVEEFFTTAREPELR